MAGHPHADDHKIDLRVLRHGVDVVKSVHSVELFLRGLGGVLVGRTDRLECVVRQEVERRDVGVGAPAAAALRHGRANDAGANGVSHGCVSPLVRLGSSSVSSIAFSPLSQDFCGMSREEVGIPKKTTVLTGWGCRSSDRKIYGK